MWCIADRCMRRRCVIARPCGDMTQKGHCLRTGVQQQNSCIVSRDARPHVGLCKLFRGIHAASDPHGERAWTSRVGRCAWRSTRLPATFLVQRPRRLRDSGRQGCRHRSLRRVDAAFRERPGHHALDTPSVRSGPLTASIQMRPTNPLHSPSGERAQGLSAALKRMTASGSSQTDSTASDQWQKSPRPRTSAARCSASSCHCSA